MALRGAPGPVNYPTSLIGANENHKPAAQNNQGSKNVSAMESEIRELRAELDRTVRENELLVTELRSRPSRADMMAVLQKLRKYEAIAAQQDTKKQVEAAKCAGRNCDHLFEWTEDILSMLNAADLNEASTRIRELLQAEKKAAQYETLLMAIEQRLARVDAPRNAALAVWFENATSVFSHKERDRNDSGSANTDGLLSVSNTIQERRLQAKAKSGSWSEQMHSRSNSGERLRSNPTQTGKSRAKATDTEFVASWVQSGSRLMEADAALRRFECLPAIAQSWLDELTALPSVIAALNRLVARIVPFQVTPLHVAGSTDVKQPASLCAVLDRIELCLRVTGSPRDSFNEKSPRAARSAVGSRDNLTSGVKSGSRDSLAGRSGRESGCECECVCECRRALDHFCKLFSVTSGGSVSLGGALSKMNDLYTRIGEAENVRRALAHVLEQLDLVAFRRLCDVDVSTGSNRRRSQTGFEPLAELKDTTNVNYRSSVQVVATVERLVEAVNRRFMQELINAVPPDAHESAMSDAAWVRDLMERVGEYERFLPAFHKLVRDLLDALAIDRVDLLVPSVRALRALAGTTY